ncbi:circularly permuted type 2 ATP-grasp protein [Paraglaciecola aquimarina]|uniref:Circularly permuted type 2 ATP-grasp protein n=1 Tax=Paraglaciecola algarum TaxID=3050085 RepID=A0ABS9DAU9_9ALTE|nr:circularly permuted type 2 ATP-grasp protein [Paraglaciecola sp. G1-23]MCF2948924.1 circularly permuted type 2 ATP-grasp protein [Paraglaciecola sp. G1-23]
MNLSSDNNIDNILPDWLAEFKKGINPINGVNPLLEDQLQQLSDHLALLNREDIGHRAAEIKRLLRNSGFIDTNIPKRLQLDPLPLLISQNEWLKIELGVRQRIKLDQAILDDFNSHKLLITQGVVSPLPLMQHPHYLREATCLPNSERGLFMLAYDIGRDNLGQYVVLDSHYQFPVGLGLLLENRIVARRVMSEEFAECGAQRIAGFFRQLQESINLKTEHLRDPRIVILTKGPDDPYYSEHAYLATYLGYTLVRSADITVRKGKVWLKALDGLRKIDVILRWIEDRYLDSLEQTEYSLDGVSGLLQAIRSHSVILLNPFGNCILQIPAIKNQLNEIAQSLLVEPLLLGTPSTFKPGEVNREVWHDHTLYSYLDPNFKLAGDGYQVEIEQLLATNSQDYYFCKNIELTHAPFWQNKKLVSKPVIMRCYALVSNNEVHVLPSALCSTLTDTKTKQSICIKDTWVQTGESNPIEQPKLPKPARKITDMALVEGLIPSRTAENLFWLGSLLERSENTSRLVRIFIDLFTEVSMYPDVKHRTTIKYMQQGLESQALTFPYNQVDINDKNTNAFEFKHLAIHCIKNPDNLGSVFSNITGVCNFAMQVRELLSYDSLRIIENLETEQRRLDKFSHITPTHMFQSSLDRVIGLVMAFNGSVLDSMSNSNGFFMLEIGRKMERCLQLVAMVDTMLIDAMPEAEQQNILESVLVSQVSSITHRRRYRVFQSIETGLELLLLDTEYPRSLAFQVEQLISLSKRLPESTNKPSLLTRVEKSLLKLKAECMLVDRDEIAYVLDNNKRIKLSTMMKQVKAELLSFKEILHTQYFSHTKTAKQFNWSIKPNSDTEIQDLDSAHI